MLICYRYFLQTASPAGMIDTVACQSVCQQWQCFIEVVFPLEGKVRKNWYMYAIYSMANIDFSFVIYTLRLESIRQQTHVNWFFLCMSNITLSLPGWTERSWNRDTKSLPSGAWTLAHISKNQSTSVMVTKMCSSCRPWYIQFTHWTKIQCIPVSDTDALINYICISCTQSLKATPCPF